MKKLAACLLTLGLLLTGCAQDQPSAAVEGAVTISLSDETITVDGKAASENEEDAVYLAQDIVYYPTGKDFTFGEGEGEDLHEAAEADGHTVVHITEAGKYVLSGKLSAGQIAVDLGEDAEENPDAVVTLYLNGVDITCTVAPAVIFYNVYECDTAEEHSATVDTAAAGANVVIIDGTENHVSGSYVARIYQPDSVELSEDGTEVEDAKKLHKYDGAFYSRMSMNVDGNDGILNISAENEGLDSEMHLTINGGDIRIESGNDGINTNEDEVSVTTINGGKLTVNVRGTTGEGDGIDSNGWIVINGGTVISAACASSADAGLDSDMGIYLNGGTVIASGNMYDHIADGEQTYVVLNFSEAQENGTYTLKNAAGEAVMTATVENRFTYLILSDSALEAGEYTLWNGETQLAGAATESLGMHGGMGGERPGDMEPPTDAVQQPDGKVPEKPDGVMPGGEVPEKPDGVMPSGEAPEKPDGEAPEKPDGEQPDGAMPANGRFDAASAAKRSKIFSIKDGANYFVSV